LSRILTHFHSEDILPGCASARKMRLLDAKRLGYFRLLDAVLPTILIGIDNRH
jgi:hypothetical protein